MNKYFSILNHRTLLAVTVSFIVSYFTIAKDFQYNYDLSLVAFAIIFPLVFTIRSAFRRREKALEYLSGFKAGLITVNDSFSENKKLESSQIEEVQKILLNINEYMIAYLGPKTVSKEKLAEEIKKVAQFIKVNTEKIGNGTSLKIFRFMKEVHESAENIIAINNHRTPISMRAYTQMFIYAYPIIFTPSLYHKLQDGISLNDTWIVYALSSVSTFVLISLYNVQDQMENPFDQKGLDDIRLNDFRL